MIASLNRWVTRALLVTAALLAFSLSFLVCADVIGRVVFNSPVKGTKEIVEISIVIICFLQAGYAIRSGGMLHVDVVTGVLPFRARSALVVLGAILGVAFFALIVWGSLEPFGYAWREGEYEGEGALRVPVWPARLAVLVGSGLAAFNYLLLAVEAAYATVAGRPVGAMVDVGGRIH